MISKCSGRAVDSEFTLQPDDTEFLADGVDSARVVLRVIDEFGLSARTRMILVLTLEGPAEMIGDNPEAPITG